MLFHYVYLASLLISAVAGFTYRQHLKSRRLFLFVPFLLLLFIQEILLFFYIQKWPKTSTGVVYNCYFVITTFFIALFYYSIPFNAALRKLILWMLFIYSVIVIFTFSFLQSLYVYNSYLTLASGAIITCCAVFFLFNYFNLDNRTLETHWLPVVWITLGIVVFYPVTNISFAFYKHLLAYRAEIFGLRLYNAIPQLMSIFMYGCFTYSFYLCKKKN